MKILALDTATENCSAALIINGAYFEREQLLGRGAAEAILPLIRELLTGAAVALRDLDAIAFGRGPGGFTGVRLAASVTQGLAFGAGLRVVPVSNLQALAQRILSAEPKTVRVLAALDARMGEVYFGAFERTHAGLAVAAGPECVVAPEQVSLPKTWFSPPAAVGAGSGFDAYPQLKAALAGHLGAVRERLLPRAREIAQLAMADVKAGRLLGPEGAVPVYLRDNVAQPRAMPKS